jgi:hypothetical protein
VWPKGKRSAVSFTFDFDAEEVWLADDPANADRPVALSQGTFGAKVAVPQISTYSSDAACPTWFVPGRVAERHPERVRRIVEAGHELACHGFTHREPAGMAADEEERELARAREALDVFGATVCGYRAPGWACSPRTIALIARHGFSYSSNFMDDIRPYLHEGTSVVELPVSWVLDDAPHFWFDADSWDKKISTERGPEIWQAELLRSASSGLMMTFHPQVIGRPGRLRLLEELVRWVIELGDVATMTCAEALQPMGLASGRSPGARHLAANAE